MKPTETANPPAPAPALTIRLGAVFAFMPDGRRLVVSGTGPTSAARMVSAATGQELFSFKPPPSVRGVAVSGDGERVALAAHRDRVILYDSQIGGRVQAFQAGNDADLSGLEFAPGSRALLHSSWHGLTAMDGAFSPAVRPLRVSAAYPDNTMYFAIAFSPAGDRFAAARFDHTQGSIVSIYGWPSGDEIAVFPCAPDFNSHPNQLLFAPDGQSLVLKMADGSVTVGGFAGWTPPDPKTAWIRPAEAWLDMERSGTGYGGGLCLSPDGALLAYGQRGMLGLWAWPPGDCLGKARLPGRDPVTKRVAFSPSGREVAASVSGSHSVFIYRVADLTNARNINGNQ